MKKFIFPLILFGISLFFFYKTIFQFQVPFPGDLLISEYAPWKYESYLGYNPGSYPNKAQYFDVIRQLYPWKMLVVDELKNGRIPLWNPYNFSGSPLLANNQSSVFSPMNILFFIFSPVLAWTIFIFIQPLLASIFMYLYLQEINTTKISSAVGGVGYGFSLFMSTFLEYGNFGHTIMWLPLSLVCLERIDKRFYQILFALIVAIILFSGHLQLAFGCLLFIGIYIFIRSKQKIKAFLLYAIGIGISSVQLFPTFELILNSARVPHNISTITDLFLIQFHQLIFFVSPDIYGNPATRNYLLTDTYPGNALYIGIVPFVFALYAFLYFKKNEFIRIYAVSAVLLLIFLTNNPISLFFNNLHLPFVSTSASSNFIFLLTFCLCVLSAVGISTWQKTKNKKIYVVVISLLVSCALMLLMHIMLQINFYPKLGGIGIVLLLIVGFVIFLRRFIPVKLILGVLLLITVLDLFYYFQKFNPFVPTQLVYPKTTIENFLRGVKNERYWGVGGANIEGNFSTVFRTFSPEGYDPLYPSWYARTFYSDRGIFASRSDARLEQVGKDNSIESNKTRSNVLDQLGVRYILSRKDDGYSQKTFPPDRFEIAKEIDNWQIYQNKSVWPRAFVIPNTCHKKAGKYDCLDKKYFQKATITATNSNEIRIKTGSESGYLILSDTYYPGWNAYIDGKKLDVIKLNNATRGVENVQANKTVVMKFESPSFNRGLIVTIISIVVLFGISFIRYEKR